MTHPYDVIPLENNAQLIMTPCPGTKEVSVEDSISTLKNVGATTLLTLMLPEEQVHYGITNLQEASESLGLYWLNLPISDDEKPDERFEKPWALVKDALVSRLRAGETIALHCKGGQGRTSLVSALLMLGLGLEFDEVKRQVQSVKPRGLVIEKHLAYIADYINR